jgi:nicotinate-nucleotide adenylyltransferase
LLGGSFDPIHLAHIALASTALDALALDEVQLIPAANPWQRPPLAASPMHRLAMLDIAVRGQPRLRINPTEILRGGQTYTIDTLEQLPRGRDYYWILGADQLANFCSWHRWEDILLLANLAVALRPGTQLTVPAALRERLDKLERRLEQVPMVPLDIFLGDPHPSCGRAAHRRADRCCCQAIHPGKSAVPDPCPLT